MDKEKKMEDVSMTSGANDKGSHPSTDNTSVGENNTGSKVANTSTTENEVEVVTRPDQPKKKRKEQDKRAECWSLFDEIPGSDPPKAQCKKCGQTYLCHPLTHGTSNLVKHMKRGCKGANDEKQSILSMKGSGDDIVFSNWKYDKDKCRKDLALMVVAHELPFRFVEGEFFRRFVASLQPIFTIPSRVTVAKDCYELFVEERGKLMASLKSNNSSISITTDTWTSVQRINYMCLTGHYIDENWTIQKRILNFFPITSHKGRVLGMQVEQCLRGWGIENLMTVTVDNANNNDSAIAYLKSTWSGTVLKGQYLHMRCVAHIMNLVVQDGIKLADNSVLRVRNAVRYIRSSPARLLKFKTCIDMEKIEFKGQLCLDVATRWNSTYLMLQTALRFRKAFDRYTFIDSNYDEAMMSCDGLGRPLDSDWSSVEGMVKMLATFYELTLRVFGSLYVTENSYFNDISRVFMMLDRLGNDESVGVEFQAMCQQMKKKCDKYWGNAENMNVMIFVAIVFDLHFKLGYVQYGINKLYSENVALDLIEKVKKTLNDLFKEYKSRHASSSKLAKDGTSSSRSQSSTSTVTRLSTSSCFEDAHSLMNEYLHLISGSNTEGKTELDKYLEEDVEAPGEGGINSIKILNWWKVNSPRFPVLSLVARDVLGIPVSTVASEFAFSTSGRMLDQYRSSLTPKMVEALVCAQDWLKIDKNAVTLEEHLAEIQNLEAELNTVSNAPAIIDIDI